MAIGCVSLLSVSMWAPVPSAAAQSSYIPPAKETRTAADSAANAPAVSVATPLLMTGFPIPHTSVDFRTFHLLRGCQATFQRAIDVSVAEGLDSLRMARARDRSPQQNDAPESTYVELPDSVIAMGRKCLADLGDTKTFLPVTLPLLLRYAIWIDDDTLIQNVVTRQLAIAGSVVWDRGHVLALAIDELLHNRFSQYTRVRRTPAHDALAIRYAAQIDTMQPPGQVLLSRMNVSDTLDRITHPKWDVDHLLERLRANLTLIRSVPPATIAPADVETIEQIVRGNRIGTAWATYLKTPTHANLAAWIAIRDSLFHIPPGQTLDSLINRPAPSLEGDFWFNLPAGAASPPTIPAPGVFSLLLFVDSLRPELTQQLRQLHTQYPALQLVLVSMTRGGNRGTALSHAELQPEAEQIAKRFTDGLRFPVMVCVLETKYHTEADAKDIPVASPVLNRFHLDRLEYHGHAFLVNAEGALIEDRMAMILDAHVLQRLLERR